MSKEAETDAPILVFDSDEEGENDGYAKLFNSPSLVESTLLKENATEHFQEWEGTIIDVSSMEARDSQQQLIFATASPSQSSSTYHGGEEDLFDDKDDPYWLETLAGDIPALQAALRRALITNDVPTLQELINFGVIRPFNFDNIMANCEHLTGRSPVWYAASGGSNDCIQFLADWCYNSYMNDCLHHKEHIGSQESSTKAEHEAKARREVTAFLDLPSKHGSRPILIATVCNRPDTVQFLLDYGVDVNSSNEYNSTAALLAAMEGHFEILNILAKHGANLDLPNLQGTTPVIVAAQNGRVDIIKFLYLYGVNLNHVNEMGMSCIGIAAYYNKPEVIEFLSSVASIDENAPDLNQASGSLHETPLCIAARMGNVEALRALLSSPHVNVVQTNSLGMSALFIATKLNHVDVVSAIISANYSDKDQLATILNLRDKASGMTPLFCALILGHTRIVELLAPLSDLSVLCGKEGDGNLAPAILAAAAKNEYDTCALLLQAGANVDQCDQMGHTALAIAARHGFVELCELLVQHGAEIGHRSKKGRRTALQKAKKYKHAKVVELFDRYGAGAGEVLV